MSTKIPEPPLATMDMKPSSDSVSTSHHEAPSESHEDKENASPSTGPLSTPPPGNNVDPAEAQYRPRSPTFWLIIASAYIAFFLVALDRTIIATAIPSITNTFDSIEDIAWYGSSYMLTCAIFNPFFGKVYQLYDTKWTFLVSTVIFEAGSALCGAAPSSVALIVGRAISGIGAAGIGTGAVMITILMIPLQKRPIFMSCFGVAFGVSSVVGPLIGGSFTDSPHLTWRWCFYINLPIGGFAMAAALIFLRLPSPPKKKKLSYFAQFKTLDPLGLLFFTPSMICLILALQWGGTTYPWSEPKIIGLLVTFAVTLILFLIVEWKMPATAMAPARVVLQRSVCGSLFFTFFLSGGMMILVYYVSIWFQAAQNQSAMQAGIRTIPMVVSLVIFSIGGAILTQKIGYYFPQMLLSPVLASIAAGLLSTITPTAGSNKWAGYQVFYGIGIGVGLQAGNIAIQTVLPRADLSIGTAMLFFMQQLGGSIFLSVGQNIFSRGLISKLSGIAGLNTAAIVNTGATELRNVVPASEIDTVVNAYSHALSRTFVLAAGLNAATILGALMVEWRSIKKAGGEPAKDAGTVVEEGKSKSGE